MANPFDFLDEAKQEQQAPEEQALQPIEEQPQEPVPAAQTTGNPFDFIDTPEAKAVQPDRDYGRKAGDYLSMVPVGFETLAQAIPQGAFGETGAMIKAFEIGNLSAEEYNDVEARARNIREIDQHIKEVEAGRKPTNPRFQEYTTPETLQALAGRRDAAATYLKDSYGLDPSQYDSIEKVKEFALKGIDEKLKDSTVAKTAEWLLEKSDFWRELKDEASERWNVDPMVANSTAGQLISSVGMAPGFIGLTALGPLGLAANQFAFYSFTEDDARQAAEERGEEFNPEDHILSVAASATGQALLERAFGFERVADKVLRDVGKNAKMPLKEFIKQVFIRSQLAGAEEALTEPAQGAWQDFIASISYDDGREQFSGEKLKQRFMEALAGYGLGVFMGGGMTALATGPQIGRTEKAQREQELTEPELNERVVAPEGAPKVVFNSLSKFGDTEVEQWNVVDPQGFMGINEPDATINREKLEEAGYKLPEVPRTEEFLKAPAQRKAPDESVVPPSMLEKIQAKPKPLGEAPNMTPEQQAEAQATLDRQQTPEITGTPEFQQWFEGSKAVDETGQPQVMYHGSTEDFTEFDKAKIRPMDFDAPVNGFWFSSDPHPSPAFTGAVHTKPFYIDLKNPAPIDVVYEVRRQVARDDNIREGARSAHDEVRMRLQEMGYDGIVWGDQPRLMPTDDPNVFKVEGPRYTDRTLRYSKEKVGVWEGDVLKEVEVEGWDYYDGNELITGYSSPEDFLESHSEKVIIAFEPSQIRLASDVAAESAKQQVIAETAQEEAVHQQQMQERREKPVTEVEQAQPPVTQKQLDEANRTVEEILAEEERQRERQDPEEPPAPPIALRPSEKMEIRRELENDQEWEAVRREAEQEANAVFVDETAEPQALTKSEKELYDLELNADLDAIGMGPGWSKSWYKFQRKILNDKIKIERQVIDEKRLRKKHAAWYEEKLKQARQTYRNVLADRDAAIEGIKLRHQQRIEILQARQREALANEVKRRVDDINARYAERQDLEDALGQLERMVDQLPVEMRGKFKGFKRLAGKKTERGKLNELMRASDRITRLMDEFTLRSNQKALANTVKRVTKVKKLPIELNVFKDIKRIGDMPRDLANARADELLDIPNRKEDPRPLTEDEREEVVLLKTFGGMLNMDDVLASQNVPDGMPAVIHPSEMVRALEEADYILKSGRTRVRERIDARNARHNNARSMFIRELLGRAKLKTTKALDWDESKRTIFKKIAQTYDNWANIGHDDLELLLENLRVEGKKFAGFLQDYFVRRARNAAQNVQTRNRKHMEYLNDAFVNAIRIPPIDENLNGVERWRAKMNRRLQIYQRAQEWSTIVDTHGISYNHQGERGVVPMSKWEALSAWMQWKMRHTRSIADTFEKMEIDDGVMAKIEEFIGEEGMDVGRAMLAEYERIGLELDRTVAENDFYNIRIEANYSPITRYKDDGTLDDDIESRDLVDMDSTRVRSERNRYMIERVPNTRELAFMPANDVFRQHTAEMNHYFEFASLGQDVRAVFKHPDVRRAIRQRTGNNDVMTMLDKIWGDILAGGVRQTKVDRRISRVIQFNTVGSLALRIPVFFKQLGSAPAYANEMPIGKWAEYHYKFFTGGKKAVMDRVMTLVNTDYIQNRLSNSYDRELTAIAKQSTNQAMVGIRSAMDELMILTRLGDVGAIVAGGWPLYQYTYDQTYADAIKQGMGTEAAEQIARAEAEMKFVEVTARQQQDSNLLSQGYYQRMPGLGKAFTQYMTTPIQYHRMVTHAMKAYLTEEGTGQLRLPGSSKKPRMSRVAIAKQVFFFHFLLPQIYTAIGSAFIGMFSDDDEAFTEFWDRQITAAIVGNFNSIFIGGEIMQAIVNAMMDEDNESMLRFSLPVLETASKASQGLVGMARANDWDERWDDMDKLLEALGQSMGFPYAPAKNTMTQAWRMLTGAAEDDKHPWLKLMGWSDYQIPGEDEE